MLGTKKAKRPATRIKSLIFSWAKNSSKHCLGVHVQILSKDWKEMKPGGKESK